MYDGGNKQKISKNFYIHEFLCKCGKCDFSKPGINPWNLVDLMFIQRLQRLRDDFAKPLKINSGARCAEYNAEIGGTPKSGHIARVDLPCRACDISIKGWHPGDKFEFLKLAFANGFRGIGIAESFIHVDTKSRKAYWVY